MDFTDSFTVRPNKQFAIKIYDIYHHYYKFSTECASGGQYLVKIWSKVCSLFFDSPCIVICSAVTDADGIEVASPQLSVKPEMESVLMNRDSTENSQPDLLQPQHIAPVILAAGGIPSTITVVTSHDPNVFFQRHNAVAAVGRNMTAVKCTMSLVLLSHIDQNAMLSRS